MNLLIGLIGNVDQGKTSFLDWIFKTNIISLQPGEITQSLRVKQLTKSNLQNLFKEFSNKTLKIKQNIYIIDTPGHGYFGVIHDLIYGITDLTIVFQDITQSLNEKTIKIIKNLQDKNQKFVLALTKLDLIPGWVRTHTKILLNIKVQENHTKTIYERYLYNFISQLYKYNIYSEIFNSAKSKIPIFPISTLSGQGIIELLLYINLKFKSNLNLKTSILLDKFNTEYLFLVSQPIKNNDIMYFSNQKVKIQKIRNLQNINVNLTSPKNCYYLTFKKEIQFALLGSILSKFVLPIPEKINLKGFILKSDSLGKLSGLENLAYKFNLNILESSLLPIKTRDTLLSLNNTRDLYKNILCLSDTKPKYNTKIIHSNLIYQLQNKINLLLSYQKDLKISKILNRVIKPCRLRIIPKCIFKKSKPYVIGCYVEFGKIYKSTKISNNRLDCIGEIINIEVNNKKQTYIESGNQAAFQILSNLDLEKLIKYNYFESYIKDSISDLLEIQDLLSKQEIDNVRIWKQISDPN
jgi:translation initiation factor 5B